MLQINDSEKSDDGHSLKLELIQILNNIDSHVTGGGGVIQTLTNAARNVGSTANALVVSGTSATQVVSLNVGASLSDSWEVITLIRPMTFFLTEDTREPRRGVNAKSLEHVIDVILKIMRSLV